MFHQKMTVWLLCWIFTVNAHGQALQTDRTFRHDKASDTFRILSGNGHDGFDASVSYAPNRFLPKAENDFYVVYSLGYLNDGWDLSYLKGTVIVPVYRRNLIDISLTAGAALGIYSTRYERIDGILNRGEDVKDGLGSCFTAELEVKTWRLGLNYGLLKHSGSPRIARSVALSCTTPEFWHAAVLPGAVLLGFSIFAATFTLSLDF